MNKSEQVVEFWKEGNLVGIYADKNRKTKRLIQTSFMHIIESKSFESITVGDITRTAHINRGTFYLHYKDKFDLLDQIEQQLFEHLGNHIDELQSRYSSMHTFEKRQEEIAITLFRSIEMHVPILKILISDHGRAGFHIRFRDALSEKVRFNLENNQDFQAKMKVPVFGK